jgi:hypothetical protein
MAPKSEKRLISRHFHETISKFYEKHLEHIRGFQLKRTSSLNGPVVELVDALDSKSSTRKGVGVRFSPGPPFSEKSQKSGSPVLRFSSLKRR